MNAFSPIEILSRADRVYKHRITSNKGAASAGVLATLHGVINKWPPFHVLNGFFYSSRFCWGDRRSSPGQKWFSQIPECFLAGFPIDCVGFGARTRTHVQNKLFLFLVESNHLHDRHGARTHGLNTQTDHRQYEGGGTSWPRSVPLPSVHSFIWLAVCSMHLHL